MALNVLFRAVNLNPSKDRNGSSSVSGRLAITGRCAAARGRSGQSRPLWIAWPALIADLPAVKVGQNLPATHVRYEEGRSLFECSAPLASLRRENASAVRSRPRAMSSSAFQNSKKPQAFRGISMSTSGE